MRGLMVRVGADQSDGGGWWNGPFDSLTDEFVYVPIPDEGPFHHGLATSYSLVTTLLSGKWPSLPPHLIDSDMHLDPDFDHLTYGDTRERAKQILSKVGPGDLLVFYGGFRDIQPNPQLVYAIFGLFVIESIHAATAIPKNRLYENAHTRRSAGFSGNDIVVRAKPGVSGRLLRALPIGHFSSGAYRVLPNLLTLWGGLGVKDGYLQRSARLPELLNAAQFYKWFLSRGVPLLARNN